MDFDPLAIQAAAAVGLPLLIQLLKMMVPALQGKVLFWANLILNVAVAVAVVLGLDGDPGSALTIAAGAGLAGSKVIDITKARTVVVSDRHK